MTAQQLSHSPSAAGVPPPALADELDLDTRISLVEQRLIAREQRLLSQVQGLRRRAVEATAPRALMLKVAGVAVAGAGLVWALRRGGGGRRHAEAGPAPAVHAGGPPQLLLSLLPMAWPLLPERLRTRMSPTTAATLLSVAVPLLHRLRAHRSADAAADEERNAPPTVPHLDLLRYAGTWHEQARLPQPFESVCDGQPRAIYTPMGGHIGVRNECRSADGALRAAEGVARVVPGSGGARLQVTFMPAGLHWLPFVWADLWVLHVDESASDYRVAIAGHPSRKGLWLLSRQPQLPVEELQRLVGVASDLGYDTSRLVLAGPPATLH